ncbi:unnamed protein product [Psylliodes chrysocephalus]|uniref:Uncharacterized protein n=1 Tax=Psylliodes chrysocephalus TaxID=3402493 RepID=A0A9P0CKK7_9CUCU|nr:unnamed protein product [Psylliodes chrysocephala]
MGRSGIKNKNLRLNQFRKSRRLLRKRCLTSFEKSVHENVLQSVENTVHETRQLESVTKENLDTINSLETTKSHPLFLEEVIETERGQMDHENSENTSLSGRRLIDVSYFFQKLLNGEKHKPFECDITDMTLVQEVQKRRSPSSNMFVPVILRKELEKNSKRLRFAISKAAKYRIAENTSFDEKIKNLKKDIINAPSHVFGEHLKCQEIKYFKCDKTDVNNLVPPMKECGLYRDVEICLNRIILNIDSLLYNMDNNTAEHYNSLVSEAFSYLRCEPNIERNFQTYFESGMTPSAAKTYHEMQLIEKYGADIFTYLANGHLNPIDNYVYYFKNGELQDMVTEQNKI